MASRRRRSSGIKLVGRREAIDEGTPETRARLVPPPWQGWPQELQDAAEAIDEAVRLLAGGSLAQAQNPGRLLRHAAEPDLSPRQAQLVRRYTWWRWEIVRNGSWAVVRLPALLEVIVQGAPCDWPDELRAALALYATAPRSA